MIKAPPPIKTPKINRLSVKDWLKGVVSAYDDGRTPAEGLRASDNILLDQDGTLRPRPSLIRYGTQPTGTILGEMFEFTKINGSVNEIWLCTLQNVAGTTQIYVNKDGGAWTLCTGKTFNTTAKAHFCQVDDKILIMNGVDNLAYLDIPTLAVIPFTALAPATAPTLTTNTGLTGSTNKVWYAISANSSTGETAGSAALQVSVSTPRDAWTPSTQSITIGWSAVASAKSYNVYLSTTDPSTGGQLFLLASGISGTSFLDNGSIATNVAITAPLADTTIGPIVTRGSVINGRVFLVGDSTNIRYVRFGGTGTAVLDFSPYDGGGWVEVGRGTKEVPVRVMSFRDGRGNAQTTVLCQGTNGMGKRYLLSFQTITVGTTSITYPAVVEDNGQDGTDSPDGVILYRDALWYPSRDGFKTTGTKPQLQNILSTDTVSETIITDVKNLNNKYMPACVGLAFQQRLYWAVPNGATTNNQIWILDLARGGAWMKPWDVTASWMNLYNDNSGMTHFLVLSNNVIYEFSDNQASNDDGVAFSTNATSGILKFSDDSLEWAKVIDITFILLRPQGVVNFTVSGRTEDSSLQSLGSSSFTPSVSVAGWGEAGWGGSPDLAKPKIFGWSNFSVVPTSFGNAQQLITIEVDEELEWMTWELDTGTTGTFYQLADVIIRSVPIGVKDLS